MHVLTSEGADRLARIAQEHQVSPDAAQAVLDSLLHGGGAQAQFSHPDLGGMGQWSSGGMIMIGDMFNDTLKARVDRLCTDLSGLLRDPASFEASSELEPSAARSWWPPELGRPRSSGSQNGSRYAYFSLEKRLAIEQDGEVRVYDTGDHDISGVSQSQGDVGDLAFHSQNGTVRAHDLTPVSAASRPGPAIKPPVATRKQTSEVDDVFATIERLHDLMRKGVLTEAEFLDKKRELLARV